ncbi:MAG: hypothetical protein N2749_07345 [Clostridia bacterium]|nr:hypothetical protein [Clostridia bacterium]
MPVFNDTPQFLYPKSRQFPFDEVCEEIVLAIEKRNWKVPGLKVDFSIYGSGTAKYQYVANIRGDDFKLEFCRVQGRLGKYNDIAAVYAVTIPQQQICVYEDESGPTYYLYVGDDWDKDKDKFIDGIKTNSKLYKEPRKYLKYKGGVNDIYRYCNQRPPLLLHDNDLGREYKPEGDEPTEFVLANKFKEFTDWLYTNVLDYINTLPEVDAIKLPFTPEEIIPYKGEWPIVFSMADWNFRDRVISGKKIPEKIAPEYRHASLGSCPRLVPWDLALNDKDIPEIARDGFIWCDTNQNITSKSSCYSLVDETCSDLSAKLIVAITLKYANHVYVVDNSIFKETKMQIFENIVPRKKLTDEELSRAYVARAKTIIPITEYKGGFKYPVVLINRELDFDEIEWIQEKEIEKKA